MKLIPDRCRKIVDSAIFQNIITTVIIIAGIIVGLETYPFIRHDYATILYWLDVIILTIFVLEILIKMAAHGRRPWKFFRDPWNVFDFIIVAACFIPLAGPYAMVLRLARLLRVLKLVRTLPRLQLLVTALLKSIPSMGYISLLLFLLFYLYAVTSVFLFAENDPIHFKDLPTSILTLFRVATLEDWTDVMYIQMYGCNGYAYSGPCLAPQSYPLLAPFFFSSFVLIGTMIVLNLFIGVIMNGMAEAQIELETQTEARRQRERGLETPTLEFSLFQLQRKLSALEDDITRIRKIAGDRGWTATDHSASDRSE